MTPNQLNIILQLFINTQDEANMCRSYISVIAPIQYMTPINGI